VTRSADEWLAIRCQLGEPDAFDDLVERWHGPLCAYARRVTASDDGANDAVQDVWLRIVRGNRLYVFFTAIGDAPERMMLSTIDMTADWTEWRASTPVEVMRPETAYECANLPIEPSAVGDVEVPVRQIRDPGMFEDGGHTYLIYSTCGEQGLAAAEVTGLR